jgi:WD40 repeat protein
VRDGQLADRLAGRDGPILALAVSPGTRVIVSGGSDRLVRLWDGERDEVRFTFAGAAGPVRGLAFAPNYRLLASANDDGTVRLWRAGPPEPEEPAERGRAEE